jgi:hypothetical protein
MGIGWIEMADNLREEDKIVWAYLAFYGGCCRQIGALRVFAPKKASNIGRHLNISK